MQSELKREFEDWMINKRKCVVDWSGKDPYTSGLTRDNFAAFEAGWNRRAGSDAVPDGYKLVPIEPTREMLDEAKADLVRDGAIDPMLKQVYRAMLAAAPAPAPESEQRDDESVVLRDAGPARKPWFGPLVKEIAQSEQPERGELPELPPRQISVSVRLQKYGIDRWMTPSADYYTTDQVQEYARRAVAADRAKRNKKLPDQNWPALTDAELSDPEYMRGYVDELRSIVDELVSVRQALAQYEGKGGV